MSSRRNRLRPQERGVLILWIESKQDQFIKDGITFGAAARRAREACGFHVTRKNVATIAATQSLRWFGSQVKVRAKDAWRCPHCGGLCKLKTCQKCKLTRSKLLNEKTAKRHGTQWAHAHDLKGRFLDGRHNETQPIDTGAIHKGRTLD